MSDDISCQRQRALLKENEYEIITINKVKSTLDSTCEIQKRSTATYSMFKLTLKQKLKLKFS